MPQSLMVHVLAQDLLTQHLKNKVNLTEPNMKSEHIIDLGLLIGMAQYFKILKG